MRGFLHGLHGVHAVSFEWPSEKVDLARAAELITAAGKPVSRSSLSRFLKNKDFPHVLDGHRKLVDAKALNDAYLGDFTRETMAGENGLAAKPRKTAAVPASSGDQHSDPRRAYHAAQTERLTLELAEKKRELIPASEAAAAVAQSVANLRASLHEALNDTADALVHALGLPAHRHPLVVKHLKDMIHGAQMKFAATFEPLVAAQTPAGMSPAEYLDDLAAYAAQLSRGGAEAPAAPELEPANS